MASSQCCRPACEQQQACNKAGQNHNSNHQSLGQKVADMTNRVFHREGAHNQAAHGQTVTTTESSSTVKTTAHFGHGAKTATNTANGGCATTSQGRKSGRGGHRKKGLMERIKDGIAGRSDDSGSSSSESDSDDDGKSKNKCGPKKA